MKKIMLSLAVAAMAAGAAVAEKPADPRPLGVDAKIPFADSIGIRNFQPDGRDGLYIQDNRGLWYRAEFINSCFDLPYATAVGFITRGGSTFDKFSQVRVGRRDCQVRSLVTSAPPPPKAKKAKKADSGGASL